MSKEVQKISHRTFSIGVVIVKINVKNVFWVFLIAQTYSLLQFFNKRKKSMKCKKSVVTLKSSKDTCEI